MSDKQIYYSEYLELEKIINAQHPISFQAGNKPAHDEMLFIIIHQTYELWFKQIVFELDAVLLAMKKPSLNDNKGDLQIIVHQLKRITTILKTLVQQIDILETMSPMDFMEFRDLLRPASGFQSWQFKIIEAKLGLKYDHRHGQDYYTSQLKQTDINTIKSVESGESLLELVNHWLERMPFLNDQHNWDEYQIKHERINNHSFWSDYENIYKKGLSENEIQNHKYFQHLFYGVEENSERNLSYKACQSALFIMLYRSYPLLELPFQLLDELLEIDNQLGNWRYRHINMVKRMIGKRVGTGGSTGAGYLQGAMEKHYIFKEISQLNSFLIERHKLPNLTVQLENKLGYYF